MSSHLSKHQLTEKFYELTMLFNIEARSKEDTPLAYQGQGNILLALEQEDVLSQKELAQRLHISAPSTTEFVSKLVKKGLVKKVKSPKDGRVSLISLSKEGRANLKQMNQAELDGWDYLTDEQQLELNKLMDVMIAGMDKQYSGSDHQRSISEIKRAYMNNKK